MRVNNQIGPGGPTGCSKFGCMKKAVVEYLTEVVHPGQEPRRLLSRLCVEHEKQRIALAEQYKWWYPNFTLIEEKRL